MSFEVKKIVKAEEHEVSEVVEHGGRQKRRVIKLKVYADGRREFVLFSPTGTFDADWLAGAVSVLVRAAAVKGEVQ